MAWVGDVAIIMLAPPALSCILLVTSSVLLYRRSAKSVWYLLGALFFGLTLIPLMFPEIFWADADPAHVPRNFPPSGEPLPAGFLVRTPGHPASNTAGCCVDLQLADAPERLP